VSPLDVRRFFKRIPKDSLPYFSTEVTVGQIVKKPTVNRNQKDNIKAQLGAIKNRILQGEDFGVLAKEFSMDPGSAAMGGNLGFFKRGELAPQFEATALSMKPGEISEPVETMFGIHIIQLIERRGNSFNSRHILIIPQSSETDIEDAIFYLDSLRTLILADSILFSKAAKEYSDDQETASSGGFLTDATGASMISVEVMDPILFFTIDTLKVGTISRPMTFKMEDGTEAVRILYYKDRTPPHQANLDQDYQKIQGATKAEKRNKVLSEWFLKAQGDVFLSVDLEYSECELLKQAY
jgi:peptidyl-prolyl cis-trans isomerase SurA